MDNAHIPSREELPSARQLLRSTLIAIAAALVILVTIVLPAEYAVDPTGVGRALGLVQMGEIKAQLAKEAEIDRLRDQGGNPPAAQDRRSGLGDRLLGLLVGTAHAHPGGHEEDDKPRLPVERSDEMTITLKPGEGTEIKLTMLQNAKATYSWKVTGGVVNYDMHGETAGGQATSYEKGRDAPGAEGTLQAGFDGQHGWFWRNRGTADVTITLRTKGVYSDIRHLH